MIHSLALFGIPLAMSLYLIIVLTIVVDRLRHWRILGSGTGKKMQLFQSFAGELKD